MLSPDTLQTAFTFVIGDHVFPARSRFEPEPEPSSWLHSHLPGFGRAGSMPDLEGLIGGRPVTYHRFLSRAVFPPRVGPIRVYTSAIPFLITPGSQADAGRALWASNDHRVLIPTHIVVDGPQCVRAVA